MIVAQAIVDYGMALKLEPQNAVAYNNRGLAYETTGNFALAIKDYDIAIKLNWDFLLGDLYYHRGTCYQEIGNHQQAIKDYKVAAKLGLKQAQDFLREKGISW